MHIYLLSFPRFRFYWTVFIFILIYFEWRDTESQQYQIGIVKNPVLIDSLFTFIGSFWQVTDFHYDKTYEFPTVPDKICNSQTPNTQKPKRSGKWGNYLCDAPWRLINSSVFAMKVIESNPDFIIWTG